YSKNGTVGTQLFLRPASSGTPVEFSYALKDPIGWTRLPSGVVMFWGTAEISGTNGAPTNRVTFAVGHPVVTIVGVNATIFSGEAGLKSRTVTVHDFDTNGFNAYAVSVGAATTSMIFYTAIGY